MAENRPTRMSMTYEEAVARIPERELPSLWVGNPETLQAHLDDVSRGDRRVIAMTPGGRPVTLVSYGLREDVAHRANFNSALGARDASAYMDKVAREKPVVYFVGPVHGQETEGLTGLVNLIHVLETGEDLRGIEQPELRRLADPCRLLIVPSGNPDGLARFEPGALNSMALEDIKFWGQGTRSDDTLWGWPGCKAQHPMRGENVGFLGSYFNDRGINPMHDEWFAPMSDEAPALLQVAREEGPNLAVSLHSHQRAPALLRPAYVPLEVQAEAAGLARETYRRLERQGLPHGEPFTAHPEEGAEPPAFNLISALYHTSGATAFTFECPHGIRGPDAARVTFEEILEIQLTLYRAMLTHAVEMHADMGR